MAATAATAWVWSGVLTTTASIWRVQLVEHLAEIDVPLGLRELLVRLVGPALVHVAQGHEVLAGHVVGVRPALPAGPDDGDAELLVGLVGPDGAAVLENHDPGQPRPR